MRHMGMNAHHWIWLLCNDCAAGLSARIFLVSEISESDACRECRNVIGVRVKSE